MLRVAKSSDGPVVQLSTEMVSELGLKDGDFVECDIAKRADPMTTKDKEEVLARIRAMRVTLPEGYKFDRDEANSR